MTTYMESEIAGSELRPNVVYRDIRILYSERCRHVKLLAFPAVGRWTFIDAAERAALQLCASAFKLTFRFFCVPLCSVDHAISRSILFYCALKS